MNTPRRGRPLSDRALIEDANIALCLADEALLNGTREIVVIVNRAIREVRRTRAELLEREREYGLVA